MSHPGHRPPSESQILALVDPEIAPAVAGTLTPWLPDEPLTVESVRSLDERLASAAAREFTGPEPEVAQIPRPDGTALALRIHRPAPGSATAGEGAVLLWIHGGGMFLGSAAADDAACSDWCRATGMTVVAVDYRLAPEHPYPEPLEDCYRALEWLASDASGFDDRRIGVLGASAGGGLAVGLALLARDRGCEAIAHVVAIYPMLDDRAITVSSAQLENAPVWNGRLNRLGWSAYLGSQRVDPPLYAAPARAEDLSGLPPFTIDTAEFDLFRDEDVTFAQRLWADGGRCELHVEPRTVHGWDGIAPDAAVSRAAWERRRATLVRSLASAPPMSE